MIDQSAAQNAAFKTRVFLFIWVVLTGSAWFVLDNFLDENLTKEFHIFLQATFTSLAPLQLFGNKPLINVGGQVFKAAELADILFDMQKVKKMIELFFVYVPALTTVLTGLIFFFLKRKKVKQ